MQEETFRTLEMLLTSTNPEEVRRGLALATDLAAGSDEEEVRRLLEVVSTLFYIDPLDRPDLVPLLEDAIALVAGFGQRVIPILIQNLEAGDLKAQLAIAQALGHMGADAIKPLMAEYQPCPEVDCRVFVLYGLGKVKSPRIVDAVPLALEAARSADLEVRDTATRALGKFVESIPPGQLPDTLRAGMIEALRANLADPNAGIRAKAVRSLGKLARYGHLTQEQRAELQVTFKRLAGEDEAFDWDRAYIVRMQAKEALAYA